MLITRKRIASVLIIAFTLFFIEICRASEESGMAVHDFLVQNWTAYPYSMLKFFFLFLVDGVLLTLLLSLVLTALRPPVRKYDQVMPSYRRDETEEDILKKETSPFRKGFVPSSDPKASHHAFGKYEGKTVCVPALYRYSLYRYHEAITSIAVFGSDEMRKFSGVFITAIQRAADFSNNLLMIEPEKEAFFSKVYPLLKTDNYDIAVLDLQNEKTAGINILASAPDARYMHMLAMFMAEGAGLLGKIRTAVISVLETCFIRVKQLYPDATLEDALEYLSGEKPEDMISFNWDYVSYWSKPRKEELEFLKENWDMIKELALKLLTPYADTAMLNRGFVPDDFYSRILKNTNRPHALFIRPAKAGSLIAPINNFIYWAYGDQAIASLDKSGIGTYPRTLSVFAADRSYSGLFSLYEFIGTARRYNIEYMVNTGSIKNAYRMTTGRYSSSFLDYTDYYLLTGTPDDETAAFLIERAGGCDASFHSGTDARVTVIPYTSMDELKSITREEVYVVGTPEHTAYEGCRINSETEPFARAGLFKLEKLYYKDHEHADAVILDLNTGKTARLSLDDYDYELEDRYQAVESSADRKLG